jgi:hypothetical protein
VLLTGDIHVQPAFYIQEALGIRKDLVLLDQVRMTYAWANKRIHASYPDVVLPGPLYDPPQTERGYLMKDFITANLARYRIFVLDGLRKEESRYGIDQLYTTVPYGFAQEVVPNSRMGEINLEEYARVSHEIFGRFNASADPSPRHWNLQAFRTSADAAESLARLDRFLEQKRLPAGNSSKKTTKATKNRGPSR